MYTFASIASFQPHQVFLPFGHFASVLTGARNTSRAVKTQSQRENKSDATSQCLQSLHEAVRNCQDSSITELCRHGTWEHLDPFLTGVNRTPHSPLPWLVSHVSSKTFFENKHGFSESEILGASRSFPPLTSRFHRNKFILYSHPSRHNLIFNCVPVRGFKTRSQRTTSGVIGHGGTMENASVSERFLGLKSRKEKDREKLTLEAEQKERLKSLLAEENLTAEEQQRIKVAFAEGYIAADPKGRPGSKMRNIIFRELFVLGLVLAILLSVMGGSFRRVLIGTTNEVHPEEIDVTFEDVKGVDEAKQELQEIVEFLKNPEKFSVLGGKLPKGALLVGPPGTGKTLLARAVAGEANVPFFHAAGPEFDEILVGQGARRVRDLFNTAKMKAPCVIFIDEIDSVGAKRTNSVLHPYANQTINQLLTEMDGALLRPGRFDVEVQVPVPDLVGRKEILSLYLGKVKLASDVDVDVLGRGTTGFTGADLENLVNQAALRAAIDGANAVSMAYFENARDKILMGPERKSRIPDDEANCITAYHEGGHALVAYYTKEAHPLHKVTIIPRGPSLGHTAYIPEKEQYYMTKSHMLAQMDTMMGGRAAEELVFGTEKITSGSSSDLRQATALARNMVKEWGMSDKVGVRTFEEDRNSLVVMNELSASTSEAIDAEIKRLLSESYERAKNILKNHNRELKLLAEALLKYETLDVSDIRAIVSGIEAKQKRNT